MELTASQIRTLDIIERTGASISLLSTLVLLSTFIAIKQLRTLSNTLLFYASFANLFANIGALISGAAMSHPNAALCQFQGFVFEMFMQSDPYWSCAMAINVYLVFFHRFDVARLKKLYWLYGLICYGLPFIPAIFCLLYAQKGKGKMYGDATLWCWISTPYATVRIASYYAPIWLCIATALSIYLLVGLKIFRKRSELARATKDNLDSLSRLEPQHHHSVPGVEVTKIIKVDVSHESLVREPERSHVRDGCVGGNERRYSICISSPTSPSFSAPSSSLSSSPSDANHPKIRKNSMDKTKYAYTRVALLFCASILITWVPASANRVYGLKYPDRTSFPLNVASAVVLPLQGFWNTVIYFWTSWGICRNVVGGWRDRGRGNGWVVVEKGGMGRRRVSDFAVDGESEEEKDGRFVELREGVMGGGSSV